MRKTSQEHINFSNNVIIFNNSIHQIGYIARTSTQGKELDMVNQFINYLIDSYSKLKTKKAAIFIEPQIDTGYPDIVVVEFYSLPSLPWNNTRLSLTNTDFKILFFIQMRKNLSVVQISELLGYPIETIKKSIEKLALSGLVHVSAKQSHVRNIRLKDYYRINKIIAIEAKIDKWHEAMRQANNNIWFSTESYILLNKESCSSTITEHCRHNGLGVILINGTIKTVLKSDKRKLPVSYASFQFNEWILRWLHMEENNNEHC